MGIVVHKKAVSHMTRRAFHNAVAAYLQKAGLDMDIDVSLGYQRGHGNNKESLTNHAWMAFVRGRPLAAHPWGASQLLSGNVQGLEHLKTEDLLAPVEAASGAYDGGARGAELSVKQRSMQTPPNTVQKVIEVAIAGLRPRALSKSGLPLVAVSIVDPFNSNPVMGLLPLIKQCKGRSLMAAEPLGMDIRGFVVPTTPLAKSLVEFAVKESVYRAWFNKEYAIEGNPRPPAAVWCEQYPQEAPEFIVAGLNARGAFMVPQMAFRPFIDCDATCLEAHSLCKKLMNDAEQDPMVWTKLQAGGQVAAAPPTQEVEEVSDKMPVTDGITTLEKLLEMKDHVAATANGKLRIIVTKDLKGYAYIMAPMTVACGERFIGLGSGGRKSEEEAKTTRDANMLTLPLQITSDACHVYYTKAATTPEALVTLYGLVAQLTMEGYRQVGLSYHTLDVVPQSKQDKGIDRYTVTMVRPKFWAAKRSRSAPGDPGAKYDSMNVGSAVSHDEIPNHYVKAAHRRFRKTQPTKQHSMKRSQFENNRKQIKENNQKNTVQ